MITFRHDFQHVRVEIDEAQIATVVLDRAPVNALNSAMLGELGVAFKELAEESPRAVIMIGAGRAFVAGADIKEMREFTAAQAIAFSARGQSVFAKIEALPCPVIAAVGGYALGGGCELAMACDIILAGPHARFGQPEVTLGVIPGFGGTQRLTRLVGRQVARELCYTGRIIKAEEAVQIGLALRVEDDLVAGARKLAESIAANGPAAVAVAKRAINGGADLDLASANARESDLFGLCFATDDQTEGMAAFIEKRGANFTGR